MYIIVFLKATELLFDYANYIPTKQGVFYFSMTPVIFIVARIKVATFMYILSWFLKVLFFSS